MMLRRTLGFVGAACSTFLLACTGNNGPLSPTTGSGGSASGTTLKVSAPFVVSPSSGQTIATRTPTLVWQTASGNFAQPQVNYEVQVLSTAGDVLYTRTVSGGPANGQGTLSHTIEVQLAVGTPYRWRVRATVGSDAGPWSDPASGPAMFNTLSSTSAPGPGASYDEFRDWFFALIVQRGVGPVATQAAMLQLEPDMAAAGIILAKDVSGTPRGRIYLPTGNSSDKYARSVDVVTGFGGSHTWTWVPRGRTVCEGICP